ncbi:serine carboxypeptidase-like 51 [Aegilops tauschii subsp. strangulata]|uniref:serine carboxypeptidase-like 51 n=1 Tax=Aegilops tauschii subsp. strangulata TaxID=200361 RepID=UPI003CC8ADC4
MDKYCRPVALSSLLLILCCLSLLRAGSDASVTAGATDGSELWGYVEVRPKAHLFWWYYKSPQRVSTPSTPWPTVLWLQGGPGASGVGIGNFLEVGPLDVHLNPRNSTWLQKADLIFVVSQSYKLLLLHASCFFLTRPRRFDVDRLITCVDGWLDAWQWQWQDNPVGVGYSYAENGSALVTSDWEAAADATALLKALATELSYAPLLLDVSRLDDNAGDAAKGKAATVKEQIAVGQFAAAWNSWTDLLLFIESKSASVDTYNFLLEAGMDPVSAASSSSVAAVSNAQTMKYSTYLSRKEVASGPNTISGIMNGVIKEKLKIIPSNLTWQGISELVYNALVDELLSYGVNVTVYNGQLDVICSTIGAEAWVQKLKWDGLKNFTSLPRQPLYCGSSKVTQAFVRSYKNLHFYWILQAGHFVPADQPCIALSMISSITQSPAS